MDWTKIITALLLVAMIVFIFPRAKHMLKNSPKGSGGQWLHFVAILIIIVLFVFFLVSVV